jgi:hypothetical protein
MPCPEGRTGLVAVSVGSVVDTGALCCNGLDAPILLVAALTEESDSAARAAPEQTIIAAIIT